MAASEYWEYQPSDILGIIATVIFACLTAFHIFRLFKTRTWFCIPLVVGGLFEVIGFAARAVAHSNMDTLGPRLIESLFILLAPILFAASVYMILSRLIRATSAESYSIIRINWLTKTFVGGDVLCFLVQAAGGGMLSSADTADAKSRGENIILAGLILQIIIFGFFLVVALIYHKRLRAQPTSKSHDVDFNWERFMFMLYGASILITLRNLFRVIEYAMGEDGYLLSNEWPIYVFDAIPMAIVLCICSLWYVGSIQPQQEHVDLEAIRTGHTTSY